MKHYFSLVALSCCKSPAECHYSKIPYSDNGDKSSLNAHSFTHLFLLIHKPWYHYSLMNTHNMDKLWIRNSFLHKEGNHPTLTSLAASVLLSTFDSLDCLWLAFTSCRVLENDSYFEGKLIPFVYFSLLLGLTLIIKQHVAWNVKRT